MLLKIFRAIHNTLIGKLSPKQKKKAEEKFKEYLAIVVKSAAKGAVEGIKND